VSSRLRRSKYTLFADFLLDGRRAMAVSTFRGESYYSDAYAVLSSVFLLGFS
jgi:hypothetical protein